MSEPLVDVTEASDILAKGDQLGYALESLIEAGVEDLVAGGLLARVTVRRRNTGDREGRVVGLAVEVARIALLALRLLFSLPGKELLAARRRLASEQNESLFRKAPSTMRPRQW